MSHLTVRQLMTPSPEHLEQRDDVDLATLLMSLGRFRHLPIVKNGALIGLVSHRDILKRTGKLADSHGLTGASAHIRLDEIMRTDVRTIGPDEPALKAAVTMRELRIGCLPVVEGAKLVGIITETDYLDFAIQQLSDAS